MSGRAFGNGFSRGEAEGDKAYLPVNSVNKLLQFRQVVDDPVGLGGFQRLPSGVAVGDAAGWDARPFAGLDVHQAVTDHQGFFRAHLMLFQNVVESAGIGFFLGHEVAADDGRKGSAVVEGVQYLGDEAGGFVGQDGVLFVGKMFECRTAVREQVGLVHQVFFVIPHEGIDGAGQVVATRSFQRPGYQVVHALADEGGQSFSVECSEVQFLQCPVDRIDDIFFGIDQRAVEIEHQ